MKMLRGLRSRTDDRAVSTVVAAILLIGITFVGVIAILATGLVSIDDANQQAGMEVAEETMLQIDSSFQQSSGGNASISIPNEMDGQVSVSNNARYNLTLNGNATCSTGSQNLSTVEYESNGETVAYQGGGVWRMTEGGTTMTSPPDITYDEGSLSIAFVEIDGQFSAGDDITAVSNASGRTAQQRRLALLLYTDVTQSDLESGSPLSAQQACSPSEIRNATLRIEDSQYARAWADWARDNYEEPRVNVTNASGSVEPGETVEIRFLLGDVSNPYFNVSDVQYNRTAADEPVEVTATVTNTGGLSETLPVTLLYNGSQNDTADVTLDQGEQQQVTLELPASELSGGPGTVSVRGNNTASQPLNISASNPSRAMPVIELAVDEPISSDVAVAESASGTVTVTNVGNMTATERVTLTVDGETRRTWDVTLNESEQRELDVSPAIPTNEAVVDQPLNVSGEIANNSQSINRTYTVAPPSSLGITSVTPPSDVEESDTVTFSATVRNPDSGTATETVSVVVEGPFGSELANNTEERTISGGSSVTITESFVAANDGEYRYDVETQYDERTGSFYAGVPLAPNFQIRSTNVPDRALVGTTASFDVAIENIGNTEGTQNVTVVDESGQVVASDEVTIDGGGVAYPNLDVSLTSPPFDLNEEEAYTVRTENSTASGTIEVYNGSVLQCGEGTCTNVVGVRAEIVLEGAEVDYVRNDIIQVEESEEYPAATCSTYGGGEVPCLIATDSAPTEIRLVTERGSERSEELLWDNEPGMGNVNDPRVEERLLDDSVRVYNRTLVLPPSSSISFNATSYRCEGLDFEWQEDIVHTNVQPYGYPGVADRTCMERGGVTLNTNTSSNSENVAAFRSGDSVPAFQEAEPTQRGVDEMLDGVIVDNESTDGAIFDLATDERVYMFELTESGADPDEAEGSGDPDYNDAVIRYRVLNIVENTSAPATFEIGYIEGPNQVDNGATATYTVTVRNVGGQSGTTDVEALFPGDVSGNETVTIGPGTETNVSFELDTDGLSNGSYQYTFDATANDTDRSDETGSLYVGTRAGGSAVLEVASVNGPLAVDDDETAQATVEVVNVGNAAQTSSQTVTLNVVDDDGDDVTTTSRTVSGLSSTETETITVDLPDTQGEYSYYATVSGDVSDSRDFFVGNSAVELREEGINIGTRYYDTDSLIERDGGIGAMNLRLENTGTIGDERDVSLSITDSNDDVVVSDDRTVEFGQGDIRTRAAVRNTATFTFADQLPPGYYTYTVTVEEDGTTDYTTTGEMFLRNTSDGVTTTEDSPVDVGSSTVTVSD